MDQNGRAQLAQALKQLRSRGQGRPPSNSALARAATKRLKMSGSPGQGRVSEQQVSAWFREGVPSRDLNHLLAVVQVLHDRIGTGAPPIRRDEWKRLHDAASQAPPMRSRDNSSEGRSEQPGDIPPKENSSGSSMNFDDLNEEEEPWLDVDTERALRAVAALDSKPGSLALYARWWQLQNWLRDLIYVELRANYGMEWAHVVSGRTDNSVQHAFPPDAGSTDSTGLFNLEHKALCGVIDQHRRLFDHALPGEVTWKSAQDAIQGISHRVALTLPPLRDDLNRIELLLRDLERGAFITCASYNDLVDPAPDMEGDPVVRGWIAGEHEAARLIEHAERQYDTSFRLQISRRPWARLPRDSRDASGVLWHAIFILHDRTRAISLRRLWAQVASSFINLFLVHVLCDDPYHVDFVFSAADDSQSIAEAIAAAFEIILNSAGPRIGPDAYYRFQRQARELDWRVKSGTVWNIVGRDTVPISVFDAGGGVTIAPSW